MNNNTIYNNLNPQAVGMDSGVQFSLSNFLEDILQVTSSKMSPTSNLGLRLQFLILSLVINYIHL